MKRNILFSMRVLVLAALVPLAGCLAEESIEEEDVDDSSEQLAASDGVEVEGDGIAVEEAGEPGAPSVAGVVLPGETQSEPVPLPWTGSESRGDDEDDSNGFGPNPPPVEAASKTRDGVHDPN
jgi:hypothetical protein